MSGLRIDSVVLRAVACEWEKTKAKRQEQYEASIAGTGPAVAYNELFGEASVLLEYILARVEPDSTVQDASSSE